MTDTGARRRGWAGPLREATLVALAAALLTYATARAVSGPLVVDGPRGLTAVPAGAVVLGTLVGTGSAWLLALLAARTPRPRTVLAGSVAGGLLLSSVPPLLGATTGSTSTWLLLMHLVVAVPLVRAAVRLVDDRKHP